MNKTPIYLRLVEPTKNYDGYRIAAGITQDECTKSLEKLPIIPYENNRKIVFLFTGQGSQYHEMGKTLFDSSPIAQQIITECHQYLIDKHGIDCLSILFGSDPELIHLTQNTQPCLFVIAYTLAMLWQRIGIQPDYLIGHSIGEIAAACFSGAMDLHDALDCVALRAKLMGELPRESSMMAVVADETLTRSIIGDLPIDIAGINHVKQTIISGALPALEAFQEACHVSKTRSTALNVSHGFHSRHMDPILPTFRKALANIDFRPMQIPMLSTVSGEVIHNVDANYWTQQIRQPVNFLKAIQSLSNDYRFYLEIGPKPTLTRMTQKIKRDKQTCLTSIEPKQADPLSMIQSLQSLANQSSINWHFVLNKLFY